VQVRPYLQIDDAVESALVALRIDRFAIIDHRKKAVVFCHALKGDVVASIREVLRYRQAPSDISEPQMINDENVQNV
jgi:hypothetical protein